MRVLVVCALSVVPRYPLLTAIATRYQFTDVATPPIIETSGSSLTHAWRMRVLTVCSLSGVLRYALLTAIATRYQVTDVAMPPIIETSGSSLTVCV